MKNITLKQYTRLPTTLQYDTLLEHLQPKNNFCGHTMNINAMPWANVKYCIRQLPKINTWDSIRQLFSICYDTPGKTFWNARVTEYFAARKYMVQQFEQAIANESKLLTTRSTDSHLWEMAGAGKLKPYHDTLPLFQLGKLLGQYPFDIGRRPYGEIISLLAQIKTQNDVETEYQKLIKS